MLGSTLPAAARLLPPMLPGAAKLAVISRACDSALATRNQEDPGMSTLLYLLPSTLHVQLQQSAGHWSACSNTRTLLATQKAQLNRKNVFSVSSFKTANTVCRVC